MNSLWMDDGHSYSESVKNDVGMLWVGSVSHFHFRGFPKQRIWYLIFHVGPCLTTLPTPLSKHGKNTKSK
jgi:hypothetical protein